MIKCIVVHTGYVESASVAMMSFMHTDNGFDTRFEALQHLTHQLIRAYKGDMPVRYKECCQAAGDAKFCPDCGKRISSYGLNWEYFQNWVFSLTGSRADGFPVEEGFGDENGEWWPWNSLGEIINIGTENILYISEQFEKYVIHAIDPDKLDEIDRRTYEEYRSGMVDRAWVYGKNYTFSEYLDTDTFSVRGPR